MIRLLLALTGAGIVIISFFWGMRILMVKATDPPHLARLVFRGVRNVMYGAGMLARDPRRRQQIWALYVPVSLLAIIAVSLALIVVGYTLIFFGVSQDTLSASYTNSVSSLSVLGFGGLPTTLPQRTLALIEAFTGPVFVALLIAYLANMTSTLSQSQAHLRTVAIEIGRVSSGPELLVRAARGPGLAALSTIWKDWATEFVWAEESYDTVEGYLQLFALSMHDRWLGEARIVLDAANLRNAVLDLPDDPQAARCLSEGARALDHIVAHYHHFVLSFHTPSPSPPLTRGQFEDVCNELSAAMLPTVADRDAAWQTFEDRRQTYASPLDRLNQMMDKPASRSGFRI